MSERPYTGIVTMLAKEVCDETPQIVAVHNPYRAVLGGSCAGASEARTTRPRPFLGGLLILPGLFFRPAKNACLFAGLVLVGPGRYSLDHLLTSRAEHTSPAVVGVPARSRG